MKYVSHLILKHLLYFEEKKMDSLNNSSIFLIKVDIINRD